MELEYHQLDLRYEALRLRRRERRAVYWRISRIAASRCRWLSSAWRESLSTMC